MARTIFTPKTPIKGGGALGLINYDAPCESVYTDTNGRTWRYKGYRDSSGKCIFFSRQAVAAAFDGERQVWSDLQGDRFCQVVGPDGKEYPAGTTAADVLSGKATPISSTPKTGRGWDVADKVLNLANQLIGVRQDAASTNVTVTPPPAKKGMSTGTVVGLVAGVAIIGTIIYFVAK